MKAGDAFISFPFLKSHELCEVSAVKFISTVNAVRSTSPVSLDNTFRLGVHLHRCMLPLHLGRKDRQASNVSGLSVPCNRPLFPVCRSVA